MRALVGAFSVIVKLRGPSFNLRLHLYPGQCWWGQVTVAPSSDRNARHRTLPSRAVSSSSRFQVFSSPFPAQTQHFPCSYRATRMEPGISVIGFFNFDIVIFTIFREGARCLKLLSHFTLLFRHCKKGLETSRLLLK